MVISLPGFFVGLLDNIIRVASISIVFFHIFGMFPAFMRYNSVPSIGRNNNVLKTRWDEVVTSMQRKLLNLQHDEAIRLVNETRKKAEEERKILADTSPNFERLGLGLPCLVCLCIVTLRPWLQGRNLLCVRNSQFFL